MKKNYLKSADNILFMDYEKYPKIVEKSKNIYNGIPEELLINILNDEKIYNTFLKDIEFMYIHSLNGYIYSLIKKSFFSYYDDNTNIIDLCDILRAFNVAKNTEVFKNYKEKIDVFYSLNFKLENGMYLNDVLELLMLNEEEFNNIINNNLLYIDLFQSIKNINCDLIFSINGKYLYNKDNIKNNLDILNKKYIEKQNKKNLEKNNKFVISDDILNILKKYLDLDKYKVEDEMCINLLLKDINNINFLNEEKEKINIFKNKVITFLNLNNNGININNIILNNELKQSLLNEIPISFSKLQKMYYIYRRLCQKLSYDEEYMVIEKKDKCSINHLDEKRLSEINDNNYKIVCFEGSYIIGKFCEMFDIPFYFMGYGGEIRNFSDFKKGKHIDIKFKADEFIVSARMVATTIGNDLTREKTGLPIKDFCLEDTSEHKKEKFDLELRQVDEYIEKNKKKINYFDAKEQYEKLNNIQILDNNDKLKLLMDSILDCKLDITDMLRYSLEVKKIIFKENSEDCLITFVKNKNPREKNKKMGLLMIISFKEKNNKISYYIYENGMNNFEKINKGKLQALYSLKIISDFQGHSVSGIKIR